MHIIKKQEMLKNENVELKKIICTLEEKVDGLISYMGVTGKWNGSTFEVEKEESNLPYGDYVNPIQYVKGDEVEKGMFYWFADYDIRQEAIKSGIPNGFADNEFFDVIPLI